MFGDEYQKIISTELIIKSSDILIELFATLDDTNLEMAHRESSWSIQFAVTILKNHKFSFLKKSLLLIETFTDYSNAIFSTCSVTTTTAVTTVTSSTFPPS